MSRRKPRQELIAAIGAETQAQQRATDAYDEAVAAILGVHRTDLRCLDHLLQEGSATAGQLAAVLGLTTGSVTAVIDRLERKGYVRRMPDPTDRRKVLIAPEPIARAKAAELYGPLAEAGARVLGRYSLAELELLLGAMRRVRELQEQHLERVRGIAAGGGA